MKDGSVLWNSDSVTYPSGIVHHPAGYVLVVSSHTKQPTISVLDDKDGNNVDDVKFIAYKYTSSLAPT